MNEKILSLNEKVRELRIFDRKDKELLDFRKYFNSINSPTNTSLATASFEVALKIYNLLDKNDCFNLLCLSKESYETWIKVVYMNKTINSNNLILLDNRYFDYIEKMEITSDLNPIALN